MWSFHIGHIFGISVRVHILFPLFLALIAFSDALVYGAMAGLISALLLVLVFAFVLLHELGHSVVAMRHGIRVRDIMLWPLGGISNMDAVPSDPLVEMKIAIAGPAVNFLLALFLSPLALVVHLLWQNSFVTTLVLVNLILLFFNLIPAFPMDGGRIYRAWKSRSLGYLEATRKASQIGTVVTVLMCLIGIIFFQPMLLFAALFVILAGREELYRIESQHHYSQDHEPPFFYSYQQPGQLHIHFNSGDFHREIHKMQNTLRQLFENRRL